MGLLDSVRGALVVKIMPTGQTTTNTGHMLDTQAAHINLQRRDMYILLGALYYINIFTLRYTHRNAPPCIQIQ